MENLPRPFFVLILLVVFLSPAVGQSVNDGDSPPSLKQVIRQVQKKKKGKLSQAVVEIQVHEETGDAGGRLFWKKGRFVRTKNYHIGGRGDFYVYETVSNDRATAFTFDLVNPDGKSFTHALELPYESAAEKSYGLYDYFLFDFSAKKRNNVKYIGYPMSLHLFPRQLKAFGEKYRRSYVTREGQRYLRLTRRAELRRTFYFTEKLFINPDTWNVERVLLKESRFKRVMDVTSYQEVNGVSLPRTIRVTSPGNSAKLPFTIHYKVRWKGLKEGTVREPSWLYDPALPVVSDTGTREIHRQIQSDEDSGLIGKLMLAAIRYHYGLQTAHFHEDAFRTSVDDSLKEHPESFLLKSFKDSMVTGMKTEGASSTGEGRKRGGRNRAGREDSKDRKMYITAFPEIKNKPARPFMNYAAAYRSMMSDRFKKGAKYLEPVRDRFPFNLAADRLKAVSDMKTTRETGAFRALLNLWFVNKPLRNHLGLSRELVQILLRNDNFLAPVKNLHRSFEPPLLTLALARYYSEKEDFVRANSLYLKLLENTEGGLIVRNLVRSYIRRAGMEARPVIDRVDFRIPYTWLRVRLAVDAFKNGRDQKGFRVVRQILDQLGKGWYRKRGKRRSNFDSDQNMSAFLELARQLNRLERRSMLLKLTIRFTRNFGLGWTDPKFIETMFDIFNDSSRGKFTLATIFVGMGRKEKLISKFYPVDQYPERLLNKLENDSPELLYYVALARSISSRFIQSKDLVRRSLPVLKRGIKQHPRHIMSPYLQNALGDVHFILENHQKARTTYRSVLETLIHRRNPAFYRSLVGRLSWGEVRSAIQNGPPSFRSSFPVVVKLAYTYRKMDVSLDDVRAELLPFVRFSGNVPPVIMTFLILEKKSMAIRYLMNRFQYLRNKKRLKPVTRTLVKLFTSENRYAEAALVFDVAIRTKELKNSDLKKKYNRVKQKIDRERLIRELEQQDLPEPSERTRSIVNRQIKKLEKNTGQSMKKQMKHVTTILNMQGNPVPILLNHRGHPSGEVRSLVMKMLETYRMRQLYEQLFRTRDRKGIGTPVIRSSSGSNESLRKQEGG